MAPDSPQTHDTPQVVPWYHWIWVFPFALFLRLWLATLRVQCSVPKVDDREGPYIIALWHDRLFLASLVGNRFFGRPIAALISASRDGGWLVAFFKLMGIHAVRGSSSRRGTEALIALTKAVRQGHHAGITPDGPKGPRRVCKLGLVSLAKLTERPILILGIRFHRAIYLKSWDRFGLPLPFSKVEVTFVPLPPVDRTQSDETIAREVEQKLNDLS